MFWKAPTADSAPPAEAGRLSDPDRDHLASITRRLDLIERLLREIDTLSDEEWLGRQQDFLCSMRLGRERAKDPVRMPSDGALVARALD